MLGSVMGILLGILISISKLCFIFLISTGCSCSLFQTSDIVSSPKFGIFPDTDFVLHLNWTSRNFDLPGHGSPNVSLLTGRWQEDRPWHQALSTSLVVTLSPHLVSIALSANPVLQTETENLPKLARTMSISASGEQESRRLVPEQAVWVKIGRPEEEYIDYNLIICHHGDVLIGYVLCVNRIMTVSILRQIKHWYHYILIDWSDLSYDWQVCQPVNNNHYFKIIKRGAITKLSFSLPY